MCANLKKDLYGLKQDPRSWYARLDTYLQQQGFKKGIANNKLYIKFEHNDMIIIEVYVDDIILGSDDDKIGQKFAKDMHQEFEMSMLGKLNFLLGVYISQLSEGIFISQSKYIMEMLNKF